MLNNQWVTIGLSLAQWIYQRLWWRYYASGGSCIWMARMTL